MDLQSVEAAAVSLAELGRLVHVRDRWPEGLPMRFNLGPQPIGGCGVSDGGGISARARIELQVLGADGRVLASRRLDPAFGPGPRLEWHDPTGLIPADSLSDGKVRLWWRLALLDQHPAGAIVRVTETREIRKEVTLCENANTLMDPVASEAFWRSATVALSGGANRLCIVMFGAAPPPGCTVGAAVVLRNDGEPFAKFRFWHPCSTSTTTDGQGPAFILSGDVAWSSIALNNVTAEIRASPEQAIKDMHSTRYVAGGVVVPVVWHHPWQHPSCDELCCGLLLPLTQS